MKCWLITRFLLLTISCCLISNAAVAGAPSSKRFSHYIVRAKRAFGSSCGGMFDCCNGINGCQPEDCGITTSECQASGSVGIGSGEGTQVGMNTNPGGNVGSAIRNAPSSSTPAGSTFNTVSACRNPTTANCCSNANGCSPNDCGQNEPFCQYWINHLSFGSASFPSSALNNAIQPQESSSRTVNIGEEQENQLFQNVLPYSQFYEGFGTNKEGGRFERIDLPPQELPPVEINQPGQQSVEIINLPDLQKQVQKVNENKEIHNYFVQRKIINVNNKIIRRYLKRLLVNTLYNTNIQRVNHPRVINLLKTTTQVVNEPKLLIHYSRKDVTTNGGERTEPLQETTERKDVQLPPVFVPATAEKVGYDGQTLSSIGGDTGTGSLLVTPTTSNNSSFSVSAPSGGSTPNSGSFDNSIQSVDF